MQVLEKLRVNRTRHSARRRRARRDETAGNSLDPRNCQFHRHATGMLGVRIDDQTTCDRVVLRRLFPIRLPTRYISVADEEGKELGLIADLDAFEAPVRQMLEDELDYFYCVPRITRVHQIKPEYGFYFWQTTTDRGERSFYVQGRSENVKPQADNRLFVTDIEKCRYEVPNTETLTADCRRRLAQVT